MTKAKIRQALHGARLKAAYRIGAACSPTGTVPSRWILGAIAEGMKREHDKADLAMALVFRRLEGCQRTRADKGVCGECLLAAVLEWRRNTRAMKAKP